MNNGWIKVHRKTENSEIWNDHNAWRVFQWILWNVDYKTGIGSFGRAQIAKATGLKEPTVYKVTGRIHKKYQVVDVKSNNKFTEFRVLNWAKYQQDSDEVSGSGNEKYQGADENGITIKEVKNIRIKKYNLKEKTSKNSLTRCTEQELWQVAYDLSIPLEAVRSKHETIMDMIQADEFKHKTVYLTLRNWLRMAIENGRLEKLDEMNKEALKDYNPEYLAMKYKMIEEFDKNL